MPKESKKMSENMISTFRICQLAILSLFLSCSCASASQPESCYENFGKPKATTISETIEQAEFISLFHVVGMNREITAPKEIGTPDLDASLSTLKFVEYRLESLIRLKGRAPRFFNIIGTEFGPTVPQEYFYLKERHQEIVDTTYTGLGAGGGAIYRSNEGECKQAPNLRVGYSYLVFGGANSNVSYEPILSTRYDPFYQEILQRVNEDK